MQCFHIFSMTLRIFLQGDGNGSFLWMVKQDPPSYFFGTIHVPYTRVWDHLPNNTKRAFEMSDNVVFELDLTDPYTISALTTCQLLPQVSQRLFVVNFFKKKKDFFCALFFFFFFFFFLKKLTA